VTITARQLAPIHPKETAMNQRTSVFDLEHQARELILALDDAATDEERDAVLGIIETWGDDAAAKLTGIRHVRTRLLAEEAFLAEQAREWTARAKRRTADRERVEELGRRLADTYQLATGRKRVDTLDGSWVRAAVREFRAVIVDDLTALPFDLVRVEQVPDKAEIKRRIEAGQAVPGAHIEERRAEAASWGK
jgi:hypothetical protein